MGEDEEAYLRSVRTACVLAREGDRRHVCSTEGRHISSGMDELSLCSQEASLQLDDECLDESCTLNALQLRGTMTGLGGWPMMREVALDGWSASFLSPLVFAWKSFLCVILVAVSPDMPMVQIENDPSR